MGVHHVARVRPDRRHSCGFAQRFAGFIFNAEPRPLFFRRLVTTFAERKERTLLKADKSGKGTWDEPILPLLSLLNSADDVFTTSSCSGRSYFWRGECVPDKRSGTQKLRERHEAPQDGYFDLAEPCFAEGWWWLRFEPFIIHARCASLEVADRLVRHAKAAGVKTVGIDCVTQHPLVSLRGDEYLEMPVVAHGARVIANEHSAVIVRALKDKFEANLRRLGRLQARLEEEHRNGGVSLAPLALPSLGNYEVVGDVLLLKRFLGTEEDVITQRALALPGIRSVATPVGRAAEDSRVSPLKVLGGDACLKTQHRENGTVLEVDLESCFFSPAMGPERQRVASLTKPGDRIVELFAGIGAQAILIACTHKAGTTTGSTIVDCVEVQPTCAQLCRVNADRNGVAQQIRVFESSVRDFVPELEYDVVLCPRPEGADPFLVEAARSARLGGRLHWYFVGSADNLARALEDGLRSAHEALHDRQLRELQRKKCPRRSLGAKGRYRWVVDFDVVAVGGKPEVTGGALG